MPPDCPDVSMARMSIVSEIPSFARDPYSRINYGGSRQQFASGFHWCT
jgi:hypothetical protein